MYSIASQRSSIEQAAVGFDARHDNIAHEIAHVGLASSYDCVATVQGRVYKADLFLQQARCIF